MFRDHFSKIHIKINKKFIRNHQWNQYKWIEIIAEKSIKIHQKLFLKINQNSWEILSQNLMNPHESLWILSYSLMNPSDLFPKVTWQCVRLWVSWDFGKEFAGICEDSGDLGKGFMGICDTLGKDSWGFMRIGEWWLVNQKLFLKSQ